jgi:hypothetical protein
VKHHVNAFECARSIVAASKNLCAVIVCGLQVGGAAVVHGRGLATAKMPTTAAHWKGGMELRARQQTFELPDSFRR